MIILITSIVTSCTSVPKAPDSFDVFLTETAREMFSMENK